MMDRPVTRRQYLAATGAVSIGTFWAANGAQAHLRLQAEDLIEIDRTVGDLVVLPPEPEVAVTGVADLEPGTEFNVFLRSRSDEPFILVDAGEVSDDGTWAVIFDLSQQEPGQRVEIEVEYDGRIITAPGVIGSVTGGISFGNQEALEEGHVVVVEEVFMDIGGFVAIYEERLAGPILGVSDYLRGGTEHADVEIQLEEPVSGETILVAAGHVDSDVDETFGFIDDPALDPPYRDYGDPVTDAALVVGPTPPTTTSPTTAPPTATTPGTSPPTTTEDDGGGIDVPGLDLAVGGTGGLLGVLLLKQFRKPPNDGEDGSGPDEEGDGDDHPENRPPRAQIVALPEEPEPGHPVLFDGALSFDPDAGDHIVEYNWTIGESTPTGQRVVHVFGKPGAVEVTLTVTDGHGATGTKTETVTIQETAGAFALSEAHPDAGGSDHEHLHDEFLTFANTGEAPLSLGGWTIHDAAETEGRVSKGDHTYTIPRGVTLEPEATLTVHTGQKPDSAGFEETEMATHQFWGKHWPVWNNDTDVIVVTDDTRHPILATRYERTGSGEYEFEDITPESLIDWFPPVTVKTGGRTPHPSVSVDAELEPSAISNAVDFLAGALFLRGSKQFVSSWAVLASFFLMALLTWVVSAVVGPLSQSTTIGVPIMLAMGSIGVLVAGKLVDILQHGLSTAAESADRGV